MFDNVMGISKINLNTNIDVVNNPSVNTKGTSKKDDVKDSFGDIMGMVGAKNDSSNTANNTVNDKQQSESYKDKDNSVKADNKTETNNKYDNNKKVNTADNSGKAKADVSSTEEVQNSEDTEDLIEKIVDVINNIISTISEALEVVADDVKQSMDQLGIDAAGLLDENNIKSIILDISNSSDVDMLIDENLNNLVSNVLELVDEVLQAFEIDDKAGFANLISANDELITSEEPMLVKPEVSNDENVSKDVVETTETVDTPDVTDNTTVATKNQDNSSKENGNKESGKSSELVNDIANALSNAVTGTENSVEFEGDVKAADIVRQVVDQIKTNINDKVRSLEIRLNPENLGRVQINVSTKNGVMQAQIITENEAAKNAIEGSIALLKETFNNQELKVDAVEVMVANYDFFKEKDQTDNDENNQNNSYSRGNAEGGNDDIIDEELTEAQEIERDMMQQSGNSVNYSI